MSDDTPNPPSSTKTTTVPLKKETVRITLKPKSEGVPVPPGAPTPPPAVRAPAAPMPAGVSAPRPPSAPVAPSIGAPRPPGAPAGALPPAAAPRATVPLKPAAAPAALATQKLTAPPAAAATTPLPKATVRLTTPVAPQASTITGLSSVADDDDGEERGILLFAVLAFLLALALLGIQLMNYFAGQS